MTTIVLLGGNGYIGRNLTSLWHQNDHDAQFIVLSRSGQNQLDLPCIKNVAIDLNDLPAVTAALPTTFDYIVDFIGGVSQDPVESQQINEPSARLMRNLAETHGVRAMGYIGGELGPKAFLETKAQVLAELQKSTVPLAYVTPTLVYGAGRNDKMAKLVPVLKVAGIFSQKLKPVTVGHVAQSLLNQLLTY